MRRSIVSLKYIGLGSIIAISLAAQTTNPDLDRERLRTMDGPLNAMVPIRAIDSSGKPIHKSVIWCDGTWYNLTDREEDVAPMLESPKYDGDSNGTVVFMTGVGGVMTCHAEKAGKTGTSSFYVEYGSRELRLITIN